MLPELLKEHSRILANSGLDLDALFSPGEFPAGERLGRKYLAPAARLLPTSLRYAVTGLAKKLRNSSGGLRVAYPPDEEALRPACAAIGALRLSPWWGRRGALCLSHDVDNDEGYAFVPKMAELDAAAGLRSTFNFLSHDNYRPDRGLLRELAEAGFETGLHGFDHDQGFAFRGLDKIKARLEEARRELGLPAGGYRSPALSLSGDLLAALGSLGFRYDSSMQVASSFYHSVKFPYPYRLERYGLWELPLMIQDDNYFRDSNSPPEKALASIAELAEKAAGINGVAVINMHPHLMRDRQSFYGDFLRLISKQEYAAVKTSGEVIAHVSGNPADS